MIAIVFYLAEVFFSLFVFFDRSPINLCCQSTILLATITTLTWTRVFFIWPRSAQTRLGGLSTSVVSGIREKRVFSLNIFFKILSTKRSMTLDIPTIYVFNKHYRLSNSLGLSINCFLDYFFLVV